MTKDSNFGRTREYTYIFITEALKRMKQGLPVLSNVVDPKQSVHAMQVPIITSEEENNLVKNKHQDIAR